MPKVIDTADAFGKVADRRLRREKIVWLTTTSTDGTPQPHAVWFHWDGETVLMYSIPNQAKLKNISRHPRVSLNLDSAKKGDSIANGAVAAPLVGAGGALGVMAVEMKNGGEQREALLAAASIIASQLSTLVGPPSARPRAEAAG